ncbi:MAG: restriction endonuclease subunit S [Candidatus Paceibacterota bacterium]|jgi:type I restriction enzyme S subunit
MDKKNKTNWQIKKLGEVCDFEGGSQPPKVNFIHEPRKGYVRFLQIRDFGSDKHITYIPDSKKNRHCTEDDILLGRYGASVGKILINKKGAYNVAVMKTLPKYDLLDKKYFYFYLISDEFQKRLSKVAARSAQAGFSKDDIYDFPVVTPPLPEQRRIVKILDEVFEKTAKAKENAQKNLQNAKELFESYLQSVFAPPSLKLRADKEPSGTNWKEKKLGEIASFSQGIQVGLEKHLTEPKKDYVRFIRIVDYTQDTEDIRYIPNPGDKYFVNENDIVMVRYGTPGLIGRGKAGVIANNLFKITIDKNYLLNDYLCFYLSQKNIQIYLSTRGSATMPALNFGQLKTVVINFPSLSEQKAIVAKLDALSTETKKLEAIYKQKLADLDELKKSVLKRAFIGDL